MLVLREVSFLVGDLVDLAVLPLAMLSELIDLSEPMVVFELMVLSEVMPDPLWPDADEADDEPDGCAVPGVAPCCMPPCGDCWDIMPCGVVPCVVWFALLLDDVVEFVVPVLPDDIDGVGELDPLVWAWTPVTATPRPNADNATVTRRRCMEIPPVCAGAR